MTDAQKQITDHIHKFLLHRNIAVSSLKTRLLGGLLAKEEPEKFEYFTAGEHEFFVYEDGQTQVQKAGKSIFNLEVEDFEDFQSFQEAVFDRLNTLFGSYKS